MKSRALDVGIDYFFEGIEPGEIRSDELMPQARAQLPGHPSSAAPGGDSFTRALPRGTRCAAPAQPGPVE
jgi:hypothetical protein